MNNTSYDSYYLYLKNYLNSDSKTYLNNGAINVEYGKLPSNNQQTNGNVFNYGGVFDGNDFHFNGFDVTLSDPYVVNNLYFDELIRNLNFSDYRQTAHATYPTYEDYVYAINPYTSNLSYSNETLSPIVNDSLNNINLNLSTNSQKLRNLQVFSNFYQQGRGSRIGSTTLEVNIDYDYHEAGIIHRYGKNFSDSISNHTTFFYDNNQISSYDVDKILDNPYLGTWIYNSRNTEYQLAFKDDGTGYFSDNSNASYYYDFRYSYDSENNTINFENSEKIRGNVTIKNDSSTSNVVNRAQYRNDRFGFWTAFYDWDDPKNSSSRIQNSASRYLPIKITVNGNLTPDDMSKVIPTLSASMFDNNMWADFSANVWTYVPYAYNTESEQYEFQSKDKEYTTGIGGFTAKDITNIFDIMQNPSKYADKDGNIRLFPVFSNGKNYNGSITNGGSDAIQASFTYNDNFKPSIANDLNPSSIKMTYSSYTYGDNSPFNYGVNYAVLKNIMITNNKFNELKIRIDTTDYAAHWSGKWTDIYTFSGTQLNNLISTYGEGLYTFYLFVGDRATNENKGTDPFGKNNVIGLITDDPKSELYKKYLLPLSDDASLQSIVVDGATSNKYVKNSDDGIGDKARPVALAVEKVTNLRLVSDIPIAEDANGEPKDEQNWTAIDNSIKQGLLNAKNFTIADEVYSISEEKYNSDTINLPNDGTRIDSNNPYIYVIQNADFRFVNNLYFQIRFSNDYIAKSMNVVTDYKYAPEGTDKYMAYSIEGQVIKFKFQHSDKDGDYFIQNAEAGSGENERQGFKLKDYNARGIFDILLVSTGTEGGKQSYNMYVNRHKNSFIKLFKGNPGTFEYKAEGTNQSTNIFVSHKLPSEVSPEEEEEQDPTKDPTRNENSSLIWNGQTYLGEYLSTSTTGLSYGAKVDGEETPFSKNESFIDAIKRTIGVTPGLDNIYPIYDCVTGQQIAYYNSGVGRLFTSFGSGDGVSSDLDLFTIMKNYVLYIGEPISRVI